MIVPQPRGCICRRLNPQECAEDRYPGSSLRRLETGEETEPCECGCHDGPDIYHDDIEDADQLPGERHTDNDNEDHMNTKPTCPACHGEGVIQYRDGKPPRPCPHCPAGQRAAVPLRFEREGTVIQVGAFDKGERPVLRRPNAERLIQSGHGYIVMDVPIQGVGIATVQTIAPVEFMRAALGCRVRITVEVLP